MKKEAGMDGAGTRLGLAGAVARGLAVVTALRWRALFLAVVLLPAVAWGEQTAREVLKEQRDHRLWKEVGRCDGAERYLKAFPEGLHADEARECPTERRAEEIELPDGLTLADWALMAEDRLEAGDHARLMEEAGAHLREYGPFESVEEIREQAVSGLIEEIRVTTREDAPGALERIARIEAAAGERPELLRLTARAHGLLDDHAAAEAAYLRWLRAVSQTHPERRDVLAALTRARAAREMREKMLQVEAERFTERLGRPFSAEFKTDAAGWTDLHYAALLDLPEVVEALCEAGMDVDIRLKSGSPPFGDDLKRTLTALGHGEFFGHKEDKDWKAEGETPLMMASLGNARNAAAALTACGADVNAKEDFGETPLHWATWRHSLDVAKLLVERGADVNAKDNHGSTPLHYAAWYNSLDVAKLLVDRGADMDTEDDDGVIPLILALYRNSPDVAKLLVERGVDVNAKGVFGATPLHYAANDNALDLAKLLIGRGADVNAKDIHGSTPLHSAAGNNALDVAMLLIDRGADVNAQADDGRTPLDRALDKGHAGMQALLRESDGMREHEAAPLRRFTELLGRPFSAEFKTDAEGWTDMHYAALLDLPEVVAALCDAGMDADTRLMKDGYSFDDDLKQTLAALGYGGGYRLSFSDRGMTPLMLASFKGARNAAAALVSCGADVNATSNAGYTPLYFAAVANALDVAKLLIDFGADVNATDDIGNTLLFRPANDDSLDMVKLLIDQGADMNAKNSYGRTPLNSALIGSRVRKLLIDRGAGGATPLHRAAIGSRFDVAKQLIERGADVNATIIDGSTPLHLATGKSALDVAKLLVDRGADVNATSNAGYTPLHCAVFQQSLDVAKLLIDRGADVNATSNAGYTPLYSVIYRDDLDMAKLLIDRGADANATDNDGNTLLDVALEDGNSDMQALLRESGGVCKKKC